MKHGMDGSFLARHSSSKASDYTLSVRRGDQVTHVKIQSNGEFFDLYGGDKFATLQELVEHYMNRLGTIKETNGRVIELKYPLINDEKTLQVHEQRNLSTPWFHKHITGIIAEKMLKEKGKQGSFLVRASTNQDNALVLCAACIYYDPKTGYDVGGGTKFKQLTELIEFYRRTPMVDKNWSSRTTASGRSSRAAARDRQGENKRDEGGKPENKAKNRFKNILPYDCTRVKLKDVGQGEPDDAEFGDYINANYIEPEVHFPGCRTYIATQGPMPNTLSDFWRMVWQEKSRIIVMTTREEERAKVKCARYWPTGRETREFPAPGGAILVRHLEELSIEDITVNTLEVERRPGDEKRTVMHYQYVGWPDHNVPSDPGSVIRLLINVREKARDMEKCAKNDFGPIVVHCSAGIGRTGSVIIIDMLLNFIEAMGLNCDIDIQKLTHHVRSKRSGMVQTESQYKFVYKAVQAYVQQLQELQVQQQQQQQAQANGHEYTNLPAKASQPQPPPRPANVQAPVPPPRQSKLFN
uniref:protein-tyrosine-phosphatase n=1 Tax=Macrostomum lignano TaxID=282301 RepID=A0A1I8IP42_9PLAT